MAPYETPLRQSTILLARLEDLQTIIFQVVVQHALPHALALNLGTRNIFLEVGLRGMASNSKKTTHGIVRWTRVEGTARDAASAP